MEMAIAGWVLSALSLPYLLFLIKSKSESGAGPSSSLWGHLPILFCLVIQPTREEG